MDYKDTLNLPKTEFQMKARLSKKEPEILEKWAEGHLYQKIIEAGKTRPSYILHDGPPYANGHIHMGHALNKILKDLIIKSRNMSGFAAPYVPGWDCHGLPIELQVEKECKKGAYSKPEIRRRCREYAGKYVDIQREEFKRLGIFGLWDEPYLTMDYPYQAAILREFKKFVESGLVYKGKKPVHWCSSCSTALAEAEVEYADKTSPSVYVKFKVVNPQGKFAPDQAKGTSFVIWTTTPWTIPANLAIALHPDLMYVLVKTPVGELIMSKNLIEPCMEKFGFKEDDYEITDKAWSGAELDAGITCEHPWIDRVVKVVMGEHVTEEAGTGCVHIAPGHGQDDYELGLKYGLDIYTPVDDSGLFTKDVPEFEHQFVFKANKGIIELLKEKGALLVSEDIRHSYPHCWRCKGPIIFRATEQWFVEMDGMNKLREKALKAIVEQVEWIPAWGRERIYSMIENRPDWCLSRQRAWGVPIPALRCRGCSTSLLSAGLIEVLAEAVESAGADIWFERNLNEFIPDGLKCTGCGSSEFDKEEDILDVWFDSGVSFSAVLEKRALLKFPAELYLEGSDQHRGWFHSALLTSIGTRGVPPYKAVLTHGFVVDGAGRKMSKSTGNVIAPEEVIAKYGAEILRLWVAAEDYRDDIRVSEEILKRLSEAYRRIRNTFRYILGNISDFDPEKDAVEYDELEELDRLTLDRLTRLTERVLKAYDTFEFHAIYHGVHNFCTVDLSAFYLDILKDRLYTQGTASKSRRAAQTTIYYLLDHLVRLVAPILVFTSDEAWAFMPGKREESVHLAAMPEVNKDWVDPVLEEKWNKLLDIKNELSKALEAARQEKVIGHSLDAKVSAFASEELMELLKNEAAALKEVLIVSQLEVLDRAPDDALQNSAVPGLRISVTKADGEKCERCWRYDTTVGADNSHPAICSRCVEALV